MASTAIKAQGSTIQTDIAVAGTPDTVIANLKGFSGFDGESTEVDITNLSSPAKEFDVGLQDYGSFSMEWNPDFSDPGQNDVRAAQSSGATKTFLLTLPNGTTAQFAGLVKNASSINGGVDAALDGSVSIKITGAVTITP